MKKALLAVSFWALLLTTAEAQVLSPAEESSVTQIFEQLWEENCGDSGNLLVGTFKVVPVATEYKTRQGESLYKIETSWRGKCQTNPLISAEVIEGTLRLPQNRGLLLLWQRQCKGGLRDQISGEFYVLVRPEPEKEPLPKRWVFWIASPCEPIEKIG
ncbi:hypothetical protein CL652_00535 [bacterium]|nr:hypothetical protein [bacterium]|tara:strand:+ start:1845 stop:2318 length:474 start_codon:yes stop_codon:yes gene_type:complete